MNKNSFRDIILMLFGAGITIGIEEYFKHGQNILSFNSGTTNNTPKRHNQSAQIHNIKINHSTNDNQKENHENKHKDKMRQIEKLDKFAHSAEVHQQQKNELVNESDSTQSQAMASSPSANIQAKGTKPFNVIQLLQHMSRTINKYSNKRAMQDKHLIEKLGKMYRYCAWQMISQIDKYSSFDQMQELAYKLNKLRTSTKYASVLMKAFKTMTPYTHIPPLQKLDIIYKQAVKVRAKEIYKAYSGTLIKEFNQIEHNPQISPLEQNKLIDYFYNTIPQIKQRNKAQKSVINKGPNAKSKSQHPIVAKHQNLQTYMSNLDSAMNQETQRARHYRNNYSNRMYKLNKHPVKLNNLDQILKSNNHDSNNNKNKK